MDPRDINVGDFVTGPLLLTRQPVSGRVEAIGIRKAGYKRVPVATVIMDGRAHVIAVADAEPAIDVQDIAFGSALRAPDGKVYTAVSGDYDHNLFFLWLTAKGAKRRTRLYAKNSTGWEVLPPVTKDTRVDILAGDEKGGWGLVVGDSIDGNFRVAMYGSRSDVRVFDRGELSPETKTA